MYFELAQFGICIHVLAKLLAAASGVLMSAVHDSLVVTSGL